MKVQVEPSFNQKKRQAKKVRAHAAREELNNYRSSKPNPSKGKGKSKSKHAPDGREICYSWNSKRGSCENVAVGQACKNGRAHICQLCGSADHPAADCPTSG
eukprot:5270709-Amphidinium_carterae.1